MTLSLVEYLNVSRAVPAEVMAEPRQDNALSLSRTHRHIYKYICICLPLALLYLLCAGFCIQVLICIDGPIRNNALSEVLIVISINCFASISHVTVLLQYLDHVTVDQFDMVAEVNHVTI